MSRGLTGLEWTWNGVNGLVTDFKRIQTEMTGEANFQSVAYPLRQSDPRDKVMVDTPRGRLFAAAAEHGFDIRPFENGLLKTIKKYEKRLKSDKQIRYRMYCKWVYALQDAHIGPDGCCYGLPHLVLDYLRSLLPDGVVGEIRDEAYKVSLKTFFTVIQGTSHL